MKQWGVNISVVTLKPSRQEVTLFLLQGPATRLCLSFVLPLAVIRRYASAACAQRTLCVNLRSQTLMQDKVISDDILQSMQNTTTFVY